MFLECLDDWHTASITMCAFEISTHNNNLTGTLWWRHTAIQNFRCKSTCYFKSEIKRNSSSYDVFIDSLARLIGDLWTKLPESHCTSFRNP